MGKRATRSIEHLGDPAFELAGFSLWVHGRARDETSDWLDVTAHFSSQASKITVEGNFALADDLYAGLLQMEKLLSTLKGNAILESTEPGFKIELAAGTRGQLKFELSMTPSFWEEYRYETEIDQTYLPEPIAQLKNILKTYDPRERRDS